MAVNAIGKLASRFSAEHASCINDLVSLLNDMPDESLFTTVLTVLHRFELRTSVNVPQV